MIITRRNSNLKHSSAPENAQDKKRFERKKLGSCRKRQKPQAPTPQTPIRNLQTRKVANAKGLNRNNNLTYPNLTWPNLTYTNFGVCDFPRLAITDWRLRRWRLWFLALSDAPPPKRLSAIKLFFIIPQFLLKNFI